MQTEGPGWPPGSRSWGYESAKGVLSQVTGNKGPGGERRLVATGPQEARHKGQWRSRSFYLLDQFPAAVSVTSCRVALVWTFAARSLRWGGAELRGVGSGLSVESSPAFAAVTLDRSHIPLCLSFPHHPCRQ